jgi:mannitol-1-phosphate/altronate dehydrogenase
MYKSPVSKLLTFFPQSRDRWKAKCQEAKRERKLMANQVRAVEKSRDHWKQVAKEARQLVAQYQRELQELKQHTAAEHA